MEAKMEIKSGPVKGLGKLQQEVAEWAIGGMYDYWCIDASGWVKDLPPGYCEAETECKSEDALPKLDGTILHLSDDPDVLADFLYRVEEQLPDINEDRFDDEPDLFPPSQRLAERVRKATGFQGPTWGAGYGMSEAAE
jgi:hypothetical protein